MPRLRRWERQTGLQSRQARIRVFQGHWVSCNRHNVLEFPLRDGLASHLPDWQYQHALLERALSGGAV